MAAPITGATQKSQSWLRAQSPTNKAWLVLLAGFTEVLVTGMLIRWISVRPRPMATPANPLGAFGWVAPKIMIKNIKVITTSVTKAETMLYPSGEWAS